MGVSKPKFEDRADGKYAMWETPYGPQELNISNREIIIKDEKIKVRFILSDPKYYAADTIRVVNVKDNNFKFFNEICELTEEEIEKVQELLPVLAEEKERLAREREEFRKLRQKERQDYYASDAYKEKLLKELDHIHKREKEILDTLNRLNRK